MTANKKFVRRRSHGMRCYRSESETQHAEAAKAMLHDENTEFKRLGGDEKEFKQLLVDWDLKKE